MAEFAQHRLLVRRARVDHLAGSLQGAVDRGGGCVELFGDLGCREPENVAQDQCGALDGGQVLQRSDERQLDALAGEVLRLGRGVGVGLEPADLGRGRAGREVDGQLPPTSPFEGGEAAVGGDLVQPGADETALVEAGDTAPRADQALLYRVFGVLQRAEHPVTVRLQLAAVRRDQLLERSRSPRIGRRRATRRARSSAHHGAAAMNSRAGPGFHPRNRAIRRKR